MFVQCQFPWFRIFNVLLAAVTEFLSPYIFKVVEVSYCNDNYIVFTGEYQLVCQLSAR
jgi:hypothetical protein